MPPGNVSPPGMTKGALRGEIKSRLKAVSVEEFRVQGLAAAALLRSSSVWSCFRTVFLFLSMNFEIDTLPLFEAAVEDGKKVFVPKAADNRLAFFSAARADGPWQKGSFGIREPVTGEPARHKDFPALIITPGLAFDRNGNRLGKGGGYYDRFFAGLDAERGRYAAIGLCMDFQVVERVPTDEKDKKIDYILTKDELLVRKT